MRRELPHPADNAVRHIVATLPKNLIDRKTVLEITLKGVPQDYPHTDWLRTMIVDCEQADSNQQKFLELLSGGKVEGNGGPR